jgi:hypothetical protein
MLPPTALILRSAPQERVSKDASGCSGTIWTILRDAAARLLRMRAERLDAIAPSVSLHSHVLWTAARGD